MVAMIPSLGREDPLEQEMAKHSSILAWEIHGLGSVVGYSPQGCKELDMTEHVCTRTRLEPGPPGGSSDRQQGQDPWGRAYVAGTGTTEENQQLLELLLEAERGGEMPGSSLPFTLQSPTSASHLAEFTHKPVGLYTYNTYLSPGT